MSDTSTRNPSRAQVRAPVASAPARKPEALAFGPHLAPEPTPLARPLVSAQPLATDRTTACPVSPRACPFGGACHTCPTGIQTKLRISQPGDAYERETDRVTNVVMRTPEPTLQRAGCTNCGDQDDDNELVQRQAAPVSQGAAPVAAGPDVRSLSGSGVPLSTPVRTFFEPRLGHDFSRVRVHTGPEADASARAVSARAYTLRNDIVFAEGEYAPQTESGQRLLAHELAHVVQQTGAGGANTLMRQCDPAWSGLPWRDRVTNVQGMAGGAQRDQCMTDMIDEALFPNITVHQSTNGSATVNAAITAGRYTEMGTIADQQVNFDRNLNAKTGNANQYGETQFRTSTTGGTQNLSLYIVLGPQALNPVGPDWTQMAFEHENEHAGDFLIQYATGTPHAATAGEELRIHELNFEQHFLDFWTINNTACSYGYANTFMPLFDYYRSAGGDTAARDAAFDSMQMFHEVRIQRIPCNEMKFKIWFQNIQNARPASDPYVARINTLSGLGLTRGTNANTHFTCPSPC